MSQVKSKEEFDKAVTENDVVLVDFFATWCGPCQMMMPILEEIKEEFKDKKEFKILTVDIDENPEVTAQYKILSVPTFVLIKNGEETEKIIGMVSKDILSSKIEELLKK